MIVMITSTLPFSNYSSLLIKSYSNLDADKLIVYSEKSSNSQVKGPLTVKPIWEKGLKFYPTVIKELIKDKPDIVHIQFEINMFGTIISNLFFPLFLMFLKLCKFKLIFTMHSVIKLKTINSEFIKLFRGDGSRIPPIFLKIYFFGFNLIVNTLCDLVIVHTNLLKKWLVSDYKFNQNKIIVIPMGVPNFYIRPKNKDSNYFFTLVILQEERGLRKCLKVFLSIQNKMIGSTYLWQVELYPDKSLHLKR